MPSLPRSGHAPPHDPEPPGPGALVIARSRLWRIVEQHAGPAARLLRLVAARDPPAGRTLIDPIDVIHAAPVPGPRHVGRHAWMQALAGHLRHTAPAGVPVSAADMPIAILPFQLEPLVALRDGAAARVLIADAVGLGKTIQAALIIRDLVARQPSATVIVVVPAGLREQWRSELNDRAGLDAVLVDAARLAELAIDLPPGASPWRQLPLAIVSIDVLKQEDIRHGLDATRWDLCIIDEAHLLTPGTARLRVAATVAERSLRLVLLTATPHDGDERHFTALCGLGRIGQRDPLAVFARTRGDAAGLLPRAQPRHCRIHVRLSDAEVRLHALLERYAARVWASDAGTAAQARLAMAVLFKRAASSPWSLARSLARRQQLIEGSPASPAQPSLFGEPSEAESDADLEPAGVLGAPGLPYFQERTWLQLLLNATRPAVAEDRKLHALGRLLRRTREPTLVFTEYRDTLVRCAEHIGRHRHLAVLHGGLGDDHRRLAIGSFLSGACTVLVATDAASLGLNLHQRARLVIHLELPWNPLRLEQRVGRVDRLGQARRVHAIALVGKTTIEAHIARHVDERRRRIDDARRALAPLGDGVDEEAMVADALGLGSDRSGRDRPADAAPAPATTIPGVIVPTVAARVQRALPELLLRRALRMRPGAAPIGPTLICRLAGRSRRRLGLPRGVLAVYVRRLADAGVVRDCSLQLVHVEDGQAVADLRRPRGTHTAEAVARLDRFAIRFPALAVLDAGVPAAGDDMTLERGRAMARRDLARRRTEQLPLFPHRTSPCAAAGSGADGLAPASIPSGDGSAPVETMTLALALVLE